ncbi:MAG: hypothetical protein ACRD0W_14200 [Acidimicrobiales bacterium]
MLPRGVAVALVALALGACEAAPRWLDCPATVVAGQAVTVVALYDGRGEPVFAGTRRSNGVDFIIRSPDVTRGTSQGASTASVTFTPGAAGEVVEIQFFSAAYSDNPSPVCSIEVVAAGTSPEPSLPEQPSPTGAPCSPPMSCGPQESTTAPGS